MKRNTNGGPPPTLKLVRCAVYTRKSTEEGLEQEFNSLDAQRESGEAFIRSQAGEGWALNPDRYDDGGFTGGNTDRPALQRLLADIDAGKVDCVVVYKVDRLSRSLLDFAQMMRTFEEHGVSFVSVTQAFNTGTSMGRLVLNVLLSFAQFEREIISERTRDKIAATRRKGKWAGGDPILGYDVDPNGYKLVVNATEAERVRAIFALYLEHGSLLPVVEELATRGWAGKRWTTRKGPERGGRPFNRPTLHNLLTNVTYLGKVKYKTEIHDGEHPGIVDPAIWQRVQALLERNGRSGGAPVRNKFGALLKGLIRCVPCACAMGDTMSRITDVLLGAGDCFLRADQLVRVSGPAITPVLSAGELAGLLNHHAEFLFVRDEAAEYKPLPAHYAITWLNHPGEAPRLPPIKLFTQNPVYTEDWRLVLPGYDPDSGIYNAGPAVEPRAGTRHLDSLLKDFCFRTPGERTNYVAVLLTTILVPHFIGSKPAVLFNGNQPGLGKSVLAQVVAILRDGRATETATYNPNDEEFEKRLGAIVRRGATTIIIDNAKGKGRTPRIDSACLERSITDPVLSFRLLGYSREIRAENSHIFCITANTPDISRDLATRSVVVELYYEGDPVRRVFSISDPEVYAEEHRVELLGELVGMVERWRAAGSPMANVNSRFNKKGWGRVVGGILAACGFPDFLANAETTAAELDGTGRDFAHLVGILADHPQGGWTATELADLADKHGLFPAEFTNASERGRVTRLGLIAGRYLGERFPLSEGRTAIFLRSDERKGKVYRIAPGDE